MVKKINIIVILVFITLILVLRFFSIEVDQCDIECDNYIDLSLKEKCYKECYEFSAN